MKFLKNRIISPIKKFGGKSQQLKYIIPILQYRNSFIEGYCATSVISLNIDEHFKYHICIDKDPALINFWNVLQMDFKFGRLYKFLCKTEYSEENFETAKRHLHDHPNIDGDKFFHAAMYLICNRMSRSADMKTFGWSDRLRRGMPEYISSYKSAIESLPNISYLIKNIEFVCCDYIQYMKNMQWNDCRNVVSYIDPPYVKSTRVSKKAYGHYEMSDENHKDLLSFITNSKNLTYISGYNSPLYTEFLSAYNKYTWSVTKSSSSKKTDKPKGDECLWEINNAV